MCVTVATNKTVGRGRWGVGREKDEMLVGASYLAKLGQIRVEQRFVPARRRHHKSVTPVGVCETGGRNAIHFSARARGCGELSGQFSQIGGATFRAGEMPAPQVQCSLTAR